MTRRSPALHLVIIAFLALLAYAPALSLPFIEDDYGNIGYALDYGAFDPVFRTRATSHWLIAGLWNAFGLAPLQFHAASLLLHVVNCFLLYALVAHALGCAGTSDGYKHAAPVAFFSAAFFAVHEGHQEAIMWFSACNELLQFLFGAAALLLWLRGRTLARNRSLTVAAPVRVYTSTGAATARERLFTYTASAACFALALISKESAVIWLPLFVVLSPDRRSLRRLVPHAVLAALAIAAIWATRTYSFRFSDGSFSLHAPFWITGPRSFARLLWPWGWLALAALPWLRETNLWKRALLWMGIALVPYSFLTYSTEIPSRQTYLAGAGLALLVGIALARLHPHPRLLAGVAAIILVINVGYLWTKKRAQFVARARPTEQLIQLARQTQGPIWVQCFPRNSFIAQEAVRIAAGRPRETLVWSEQEARERDAKVTFCYPGSR